MVRSINSVSRGKLSVTAAVIILLVGLAVFSAWWFYPGNGVAPTSPSGLSSTQPQTTPSSYTPHESVVSVGSYEGLVKAVASSQGQGGLPIYGGGPLLLGEVREVVPTATISAATQPANTGLYKETPPEEYSQTNVQVPGVDEADIVKNDGRYLYVAGRSYWPLTSESNYKIPETVVYIVKAYPPQELSITSRITVEGRVTGLFISNDELVVINSSVIPKVIKYYTVKEDGKEVVRPQYQASVRTSVLTYNTSLKEKPKLLNSLSISGWYYTARMVDGNIYVLTTESTNPLYVRNEVRSVAVPEVNGKPLPPEDIYVIKNPYLTPWLRTYVNILSVNLSTQGFKAKSYLLPYPSRVYMSKSSIYVLSTRWGYLDITEDVLRKAVIPLLPGNVSQLMLKELSNESAPLPLRIYRAEETLSKYLRVAGTNETVKVVSNIYAYIEKNLIGVPVEVTDVFKFELNGLTPNLTAHGTVKGRVLDQFAMSEEGGYFMAATTSTAIKGLRVGGWGWGPAVSLEYTQVSGVYLLNSSNLKPVSKLSGLAEGERVYAARYVGNYLYLVTFRRIDPLFAIDLSNPLKPKVIGFVKMPGYSEYLHPYMSKYLIGVGYSADSEGRVKGVKVSLYNVSDPEDIKVISEINLTKGWSWTEVAWDHKAFLINPGKGYLAIPIRAYESGVGSTGALYVVKIIPQEGLKLLGEVPLQGVIRAAYIGEYIYAISLEEIEIASLPTTNIIKSIKLS